ncbi:unnamed protein product [Clonostachys byssicola]|uniref:SHSP domain-containing protein n=1 Tax=Clonostachys byssicola TaxID=160290 RepID=A0A9N9Y2V5_9HYPO|nr:unnamed protein product [Clonostachys byssicola]
MSLFPRSFHLAEPRYGAFSRFLDDIAHYSHGPGSGGLSEHKAINPFQPTFDVSEMEDGYELHGELPGLDKNDIKIEFVEPQTLIIHGQVQRSYTMGEPPADVAESMSLGSGGSETSSHKGKKEGQIDKAKGSSLAGKRKATVSTEPKFWVAERSVGQFSPFPIIIKQDGVIASLDKGILYIKIPKCEKTQGYQIMID